MRFKGIIFDLDGVIVFTDKYHYAAWKTVADELKIPFDETLNNKLRGVSRMESLDIILASGGLELSQAEREYMADEKNDRYKELLKNLTPDSVTVETRETLTALRKMGVKLAIGSSSKNTPIILKNTKLTNAFDAISDGNNITNTKPDPEVFLKAAAFLGFPPNECAVVEDARAGIDAAKAGGFYAIGIGDAAGYERTDLSITSLAELPGLEKE